MNSAGQVETWEYQNGTFTNILSWTQSGAQKLSELEIRTKYRLGFYNRSNKGLYHAFKGDCFCSGYIPLIAGEKTISYYGEILGSDMSALNFYDKNQNYLSSLPEDRKQKVIELSEVSKKWNDKFKRADESKEQFLNLPICKKVKDIIDATSVSEYVNRKKDEKEYNFKEYEQRRIRDNMILEDVKKANEVWSISQYSEEQIQCAQKEEGKNAINALYYESVFPLMNNILFVVYYILSLITLPLIYLKQDFLNKIVAILGYLALIIIVAVIKIIDKVIHNNKFRKTHWMCCLEKFSLDTSIFTYFLTSIGYMLVIMEKFYFWYIYIIMCLILVVTVYFDIVKPLIRGKDSVSRGTMN